MVQDERNQEEGKLKPMVRVTEALVAIKFDSLII